MFIRYHLIYYAIGALLVVLGKYVHPLFYLIGLLYLIWLYHFCSLQCTLAVIILCTFLFMRNISIEKLPERLEGKVIKVSEKYCYVQSEYGNLKLYHDCLFSYGDMIDISIDEIEIYENTNDFAFNEKNYLYSQNIYHKAYLNELHNQESSDSIYHWIEHRMSKNNDVQDYQKLFLLGEKSLDIYDDYHTLTQLSIVHLFALSGMHVHLLQLLLKSVFSIFFEQKKSQWISYVCIGIYVFSIPMQISLYRAFFVMVLYECFHEWLNEYDILAFLVIVSLFYNPYILFHISFLFSYFLYFVILIVRDLKFSSFFIYLSAVPITLTLFPHISLLSFMIGYIIEPFIEVFYGLCCLSLFFPPIELLLLICIYVLRDILFMLSEIQILIPIAHPTLAFLFFYYIILFHMIIRLSLKKDIAKNICMMLALLISFSFYGQYKIYGEVTMIDVGQGDCTLIRLPFNQGNVLIDTGGQKDYDLAEKVIIPYLYSIGVYSLDYVYISHDDYDHCGALDSLVENFQVKKIIRDFESYREIGCMKVTMLETQHYTDENDKSLIMYVQLPAMNLLFMGDASSVVEKDLKNRYKHLDVDILKVSHHGSSSSTSPILFDLIEPQVAMIGVKKNNIYHHPSNEVIERLQRKGVKILRTDKDGMFHIRFYGKSRYIFR